MAGKIKIRVNERMHEIEAAPDTPLLYVLAGELATARAALRLRPRTVRRLLGAPRRQGDPSMRDPGRSSRR